MGPVVVVLLAALLENGRKKLRRGAGQEGVCTKYVEECTHRLYSKSDLHFSAHMINVADVVASTFRGKARATTNPWLVLGLWLRTPKLYSEKIEWTDGFVMSSAWPFFFFEEKNKKTSTLFEKHKN